MSKASPVVVDDIAPAAPVVVDDIAPAEPVAPVDVSALTVAAPRRVQYILAPGAAVPFADGIVARGVHASQLDGEGNPLALLIYEPRGARAASVPLAAVGEAIATGLISAAEIAALQAR